MTNENMKNNLELEKWEREVEMAIKKVAEEFNLRVDALENRLAELKARTENVCG